jgi:hypothetical protein
LKRAGGAGSAHRDGDIVEPLQRIHHRPAKSVRHDDRAEGPAHDIDILFIEQRFEPAQFGIIPAGGKTVSKAADEQIGFLGAAMPGAKAQAAKAMVEADLSCHANALRE